MAAYEKKCVFCGNPFVAKKQGAKYCSSRCRDKQRNQNESEEHKKQRIERVKALRAEERKSWENGICLNCDKPFIKARKKSKLCPECVAKGIKVGRIGDEPTPIYTNTCKLCGNEFRTHNMDKKYCSRSCARKSAFIEKKRREEATAKYDAKGNLLGHYATALDKVLAEKVVGSDYGSYQVAKTLASIPKVKTTL